MDQAVLVDREIRGVSELIHRLDESKLDLQVIVLAKFSEYYGSRLVLSSPVFDQHDAHFNYLRFGEALSDVEDQDELPTPLIMKTNDPFIQALRGYVGVVDRKNGMRIDGTSLGDRYVEDGYAFRVH